MVIVPTFTLGPFVDIEDQLHGIGGGDAFVGRLHGGELVAVGRQQGLSITTSARVIFVGSNWLSTESPTFFSLKASRMSDSVIDLFPLYSMRRMMGRSVT